MAIAYAGWVLAWIMKKDCGTQEMQTIAHSITEGSEGFFAAQYGTIFKLSFVFALGIMLVYFTRSIPPSNTNTIGALGVTNLGMALFSGLSFMLGALFSAFSGYAGMWVSVRANVRVASAAQRCYNESLKIAFKGGYFAAVINIALAILGVSLMFFVM